MLSARNDGQNEWMCQNGKERNNFVPFKLDLDMQLCTVSFSMGPVGIVYGGSNRLSVFFGPMGIIQYTNDAFFDGGWKVEPRKRWSSLPAMAIQRHTGACLHIHQIHTKSYIRKAIAKRIEVFVLDLGMLQCSYENITLQSNLRVDDTMLCCVNICMYLYVSVWWKKRRMTWMA